MVFIPAKHPLFFSAIATLKQIKTKKESKQIHPQTHKTLLDDFKLTGLNILTLHQFSYIILYLGPVENYTSHKLPLNKF